MGFVMVGMVLVDLFFFAGERPLLNGFFLLVRLGQVWALYLGGKGSGLGKGHSLT